MAWHDTGRTDDRDNGSRDDRKPKKAISDYRWWVSKGQSQSGTVLDGTVRDGIPQARLHKYKGQGYETAFCSRPWGQDCPLCTTNTAVDVGVMSILKHYRDKDGKPQFFKTLLVLTSQQSEEMFNWFLHEQQGLRGCMFRVFRTSGDKSASIGDVWSLDRKLEEAAMLKVFGKYLAPVMERLKTTVEQYLQPYEYARVCVPSDEDIRKHGRRGRGMVGVGSA